MKHFLVYFALVMLSLPLCAQKGYEDSLRTFRQQYIDSHEVVKGDDKAYFRFYKIKHKYVVTAKFERIHDTAGFIMKTSGTQNRKYYRYGLLRFHLDNKPLHLTVYQSGQLMGNDEYKDYLFVPFTDETSGGNSYAGGKYLDFLISDIKNNTLVVDFNKAYNPYCAYTTGYNCPIPPRENNLPVKLKAGEKDFGKKH